MVLPLYVTASSLLSPTDIFQGYTCPTLPSGQSSSPTPSEIAFSNVTTVGLELINLLSQHDVAYSEDCLSLNVWSKPQSGEARKAVMVFIHGGAFDSGASASPALNGAGLTDQEDVVTVTIK
jgi:cholinesterase